MVVQRKKKLSPIGSELLCWIEGEQGLACVPVLACKSFNLSTKAFENTLGAGCCSGRFCVLSVLVSCKLKESNVATEISKGVVCLSISKTELEIWDAREAPGGPIFGRKLGGDPKLEDFRLAFKLVMVIAVDDGEARDVYLPTIVILTDGVG